MRFATTVMSLSTLLSPSNMGSINIARAETIVPGARSLTIDECLRLVDTETATEFGWKEDAEVASDLWDEATAFEWEKALTAELIQSQKYPYLMCHVGVDDTGKSLSGYQRHQELAAEANDISADNTTYFRPLYNQDDYWCVFTHMLASEAAKMTGDDFIVQPLLTSLKYMLGSVDGMQDDMMFYNKADMQSDPSLDIMLCPGVGVADANATDANATEILSWDALLEALKTDMIGALTGTDQSIIFDAIYMTSDAYFSAASKQEATARSLWWKGIIQKLEENDYYCDDMYANRSTWTIQPARNPENSDSILNVKVSATGDVEHDTTCMVTLSMAIAAHPNVCSIETRQRMKKHTVSVTSWLTQSELKDKTPFFDVGLDGHGQVVAVSDTGIDQNNCYFYDPDHTPSDKYNDDHRKIVQYIDYVDDADYEYGHGTHVSGIVAGKRIDGPGMADGVAPGAKIAFLDIGDNAGSLILPQDDYILKTGSPNAKIHSASWGSEFTFYTTQSRNFDQYMYDNDEFLILIAAGNSGAGDTAGTVGSPATGKNIIAVGAHHNADTSQPKGGLGPSYIADFSSRGPTSDGRTKPDILAAGKAVLSAGALPYIFGECDPGRIPEAGSKADGVLSLQGTSMATPVVSAAAAIIRQYFEQGFYPTGEKVEANIVENPSGALIKAVLMNGAQFLRGVDNTPNGVTEITPYDNNQNFGRLSLQDSIYLPGRTEAQLVIFDRQEVSDGDSNVHVVKIDKSGGCTYDKLSVTLTWVEPGSSPGCTKCVLNDLDLTVELAGTTYYPNNIGGADRNNNAERVIVEGVNDGDEATITVNAYNLAGRSQYYSLVATGCFGGVSNQIFLEECSVFDCDNSIAERKAKVYMAIFIPLGVILLCVGGSFFMRRRRKKQQGNNFADGPHDDQYDER